MTKKLTAIQSLIEDMEALRNIKCNEFSIKAIDDCIDLANHQLCEEKENLEDSFKVAFYKACDQPMLSSLFNDYFKQTYK